MFPKDVQLIANDGTKIRSNNREILVNSSSVFAEILADKSIISIDTDGKTLLELLRFVYHGKVSDLKLFARNLASLAYLYKLDNLKKLCEYSIAARLTSENVIDDLLLAHSYDMKILEKRCRCIIREAEFVLIKPTLYLDLWKMIEKNSKCLSYMYIFAKIRDKCKYLLATELNPMNVIDMMLFAGYYKIDELSVQCRKMIDNSFIVFLEASFFLTVWQLLAGY